MSTFVLACDESWGRPELGYFYRAGLIAPEQDWIEYFWPAWEERVLAGPPRIPHLHMTEIYNEAWRRQHGLGRLAADDRVQAAVDVLSTMGSLFALAGRIPGNYARTTFRDVKVELGPKDLCDFDPEFPMFASFRLGALQVARQLGGTRLDILIERNGIMTDRLLQFATGVGGSLRGTPEEHLEPLIGAFVPGGKEDPRLQAADLLCWFTQRAASGTANRDQRRHIERLARLHGDRFQWTDSDIDAMRSRAKGGGV